MGAELTTQRRRSKISAFFMSPFSDRSEANSRYINPLDWENPNARFACPRASGLIWRDGLFTLIYGHAHDLPSELAGGRVRILVGRQFSQGDPSMKRYLLTLLVAGFVGSIVLVGSAQACHKKRCTCAPAPSTPCVVVEPACCPAPAPVCTTTCAPRQRCGMFSRARGRRMGGCFHKKARVCAPAPCGEVVAYSAPTYSSPQASSQASAQH